MLDKAAKTAREARLAKINAAADSYIAGLPSDAHKAFAALHIEWLMNNQEGHQPTPPEGMPEVEAVDVRAGLNQIHHAN